MIVPSSMAESFVRGNPRGDCIPSGDLGQEQFAVARRGGKILE